MTEIKFYSTQDEFGEFSNFAYFPIKLDGKTWHTTEHYFQAQKFEDVQYQEKIRAERSPMIDESAKHCLRFRHLRSVLNNLPIMLPTMSRIG